MRRMVAVLVGALVLWCNGAGAVTVRIKLPSGIAGGAEYLAGDQSKPAVLILHGFLQTREFFTVARLGSGLSDAGYSVLIPTLSLGVPNRSRSLACDALHTHTLDQDVSEIRSWVDWLYRKGHSQIVLIGHSFGSMELIAYLTGKPDPAVKRLIAISLVDGLYHGTEAERAALIAELQRRVASGDKTPVMASLFYCKRYPASPAGYLSYLGWSPERLLRMLPRVRQPMRILLGGADESLGKDWIRRIRAKDMDVKVFPGANHFMDGKHEFHLLDEVVATLQGK